VVKAPAVAIKKVRRKAKAPAVKDPAVATRKAKALAVKGLAEVRS